MSVVVKHHIPSGKGSHTRYNRPCDFAGEWEIGAAITYQNFGRDGTGSPLAWLTSAGRATMTCLSGVGCGRATHA